MTAFLHAITEKRLRLTKSFQNLRQKQEAPAPLLDISNVPECSNDPDDLQDRVVLVIGDVETVLGYSIVLRLAMTGCRLVITLSQESKSTSSRLVTFVQKQLVKSHTKNNRTHVPRFVSCDFDDPQDITRVIAQVDQASLYAFKGTSESTHSSIAAIINLCSYDPLLHKTSLTFESLSTYERDIVLAMYSTEFAMRIMRSSQKTKSSLESITHPARIVSIIPSSPPSKGPMRSTRGCALDSIDKIDTWLNNVTRKAKTGTNKVIITAICPERAVDLITLLASSRSTNLNGHYIAPSTDVPRLLFQDSSKSIPPKRQSFDGMSKRKISPLVEVASEQ